MEVLWKKQRTNDKHCCQYIWRDYIFTVQKSFKKFSSWITKKAPSLKVKNFHAVNGGMSNENFVKKERALLPVHLTNLLFTSHLITPT